MRKSTIFGLVSLMALGVAAPATAQLADPQQLQGMSVGNAQGNLKQLGYSGARNINVGGQQWDLWRSAGPKVSCVGFTSYKGTVTGSRFFDATECGGTAPSNTGGDAGVPIQPGVVPGLVDANDNRRGNGNGNGNGNNRNGFDAGTLRNMGVKTAQLTLAQNGFAKARNINVSGKQWDLWRNTSGTGRGRNDDCVGFTSYNGVVTDGRTFNSNECGGDNGGNGNYGNGNGYRRDYNLQPLKGLKVNDVQSRLRSSGFEKSRNINVDGQQWDLWFNDDYRNSCVGFTSYYGNVTQVDEFSRQRCTDGQYDNGNNGGGYNGGGYNGGGNNNGNGNWSGNNGGGNYNRDFDVGQLRNVNVNTAQSRLRTGGYESVKRLTIDGQKWDLWYSNSYRNSCLGFTSNYGNVTEVRSFRASDCD